MFVTGQEEGATLAGRFMQLQSMLKATINREERSGIINRKGGSDVIKREGGSDVINREGGSDVIDRKGESDVIIKGRRKLTVFSVALRLVLNDENVLGHRSFKLM